MYDVPLKYEVELYISNKPITKYFCEVNMDDIMTNSLRIYAWQCLPLDKRTQSLNT